MVQEKLDCLCMVFLCSQHEGCQTVSVPRPLLVRQKAPNCFYAALLCRMHQSSPAMPVPHPLLISDKDARHRQLAVHHRPLRAANSDAQRPVIFSQSPVCSLPWTGARSPAALISPLSTARISA